jgi:protein-tyrosine phosphatase
MTADFSVLIVCTGNVHRSALAEKLLATWACWYLSTELVGRVHIASGGTHAPVGAPMGRTVRRIAAELGAEDRGHRAAPVTVKDIDEADLILTAADEHRAEVLSLSPRVLRRTFTIREAGRIAGGVMPRVPVEEDAGSGRRRITRAPRSVAALRTIVAELDERRSGYLDPSADDVIDPEGRDAAAFEEMVRQEVPALVQLAAVLWGMPPGDAEAYARAVSQRASPANRSL